MQDCAEGNLREMHTFIIASGKCHLRNILHDFARTKYYRPNIESEKGDSAMTGSLAYRLVAMGRFFIEANPKKTDPESQTEPIYIGYQEKSMQGKGKPSCY